MLLSKALLLLLLLVLVNAIILALQLITTDPYEVFGIVKPMTLLQYGLFLLWASLLLYFKKYFVMLDNSILNMLVILGFFAVMATSFEVLWSFAYWFATYLKSQTVGTLALDTLTYTSHGSLLVEPINLNWSAKKNVLLLFMSTYFTYFVHTIKFRKL